MFFVQLPPAECLIRLALSAFTPRGAAQGGYPTLQCSDILYSVALELEGRRPDVHAFPGSMFMLIKRISRTITGIEFKLSRHIDTVIRMHRLNRLNRLVCSSLLLCALSLQAAPNYTEYARLLEAYVADDGVR